MIGNITIATNPMELNFIVQTRNTVKIPACRNNGIEEPKHKIIMVDDCKPNQDGFLCGSILLPGAEAMENLICENLANFSYFYDMKLKTDEEVIEYIAVIIAGVMEGPNRNDGKPSVPYDFTLYFDCINNYNMPVIAQFLCEFLSKHFGLILYNAASIQANPALICSQSMMPEFMIRNKQFIADLGYSNNPELFQRF